MAIRLSRYRAVLASAVSVAAIGLAVAGCVTEPPPSPGPLPAELIGKTLVHYGTAHGMQVEYYSGNGYAYLWYPGNTMVVKSSYREETENGDICFFYSSRVYNPATGRYGGEETCQSNEEFWERVQESTSGDPFGLEAEGDVPFTLPRERQTLEALRSRAGV